MRLDTPFFESKVGKALLDSLFSKCLLSSYSSSRNIPKLKTTNYESHKVLPHERFEPITLDEVESGVATDRLYLSWVELEPRLLS